MKMTFEIRLDVDEEEIRKAFEHLGQSVVASKLSRLKEHSKEDGVWFHREMELTFLPPKGMPFEFALLDDESEPRYNNFGRFIVEEAKWSEADGQVRVWFVKDPYWDEIFPSDFDPTVWKRGPFADRAWVRDRYKSAASK